MVILHRQTQKVITYTRKGKINRHDLNNPIIISSEPFSLPFQRHQDLKKAVQRDSNKTLRPPSLSIPIWTLTNIYKNGYIGIPVHHSHSKQNVCSGGIRNVHWPSHDGSPSSCPDLCQWGEYYFSSC